VQLSHTTTNFVDFLPATQNAEASAVHNAGALLLKLHAALNGRRLMMTMHGDNA
jgi:hypothetical protein